MTNSRRKGKRGEREAVRDIRDCLGLDARRTQQLSGAGHTADVVIAGLENLLHVEVKRRRQVRIQDAINQAIRDASDTSLPLVLSREDREQWLATVPLSRLGELAMHLYLAMAANQ